MSAESHVRRLTGEDAEAFVLVRRESLEREPLAFASAPEDDRISRIEVAREALADVEEKALFAALLDGEIVGICSIVRIPKRKYLHRASIFGMYVRDTARGHGFGRRLLDAAVDQARAWGLTQVHLSVTETGDAARRLYEAAGFRHWGTEPGSLVVDGRRIDEHHLVLVLDD